LNDHNHDYSLSTSNEEVEEHKNFLAL
jgi:hypothetical protein